MPQTDVSKMKVADLKRELKMRGLAVTGNKNELQDRLQNALLEGDISLDDASLQHDDLLDDEEGVLTDEEEAKMLGNDDELLKSPQPVSESLEEVDKSVTDDDLIEPPKTEVRKIIIKRTMPTANLTTESNPSTQNSETTPTKILKMSERNPITMNDSKVSDQSISSSESSSIGATKKLTALTLDDRLKLRAQKFGLETTSSISSTVKSNKSSIISSSLNISDEKQVELLKKRAERFGCVVSTKMAKLEEQERLLKRKQRFGGGSTVLEEDSTKISNGANSSVSSSTKTDSPAKWDEKAKKRLERFSETTEIKVNGATTSTEVGK